MLPIPCNSSSAHGRAPDLIQDSQSSNSAATTTFVPSTRSPSQGSSGSDFPAASSTPPQAVAASAQVLPKPKQRIVEEFVQYALGDLKEDWLILSFTALPADLIFGFANRVIAPPAGSKHLDVVEARALINMRFSILGVCTTDPQEREAVRNVMQQLQAFRYKTILIAIVLTENEVPSSPSDADGIMNSQHELLTLGAHDVVINPTMGPGLLQSAVHVMRHCHFNDMARMERMLESERKAPDLNLLAELEAHEHSLLWEEIPRHLMPHFPRINRNVREDRSGIAGYNFVRQFESVFGIVMSAKTVDNTPVVVKKICKDEIHRSIEVENIYREYKFLSETMMHENIVRFVDMLHTETNVYLISEHAGEQNLEQYCRDQAGAHLDEEHAMDVFTQVVNGLGYIHRKNISHRSLSLNHVAVKHEGASFHYTLLDFHFATVAKGDVWSATVCGSLPCIAPEIVLHNAYNPRFVDSWGVGILLLEVAAGLGSALESANVEDEDSVDGVQAVADFFSIRGSHEMALRRKNNVTSSLILGHLRELLVLEPRERMSLIDLRDQLLPTEEELQGTEEVASEEV